MAKLAKAFEIVRSFIINHYRRSCCRLLDTRSSAKAVVDTAIHLQEDNAMNSIWSLNSIWRTRLPIKGRLINIHSGSRPPPLHLVCSMYYTSQSYLNSGCKILYYSCLDVSYAHWLCGRCSAAAVASEFNLVQGDRMIIAKMWGFDCMHYYYYTGVLQVRSMTWAQRAVAILQCQARVALGNCNCSMQCKSSRLPSEACACIGSSLLVF